MSPVAALPGFVTVVSYGVDNDDTFVYVSTLGVNAI
jgi:hypothetical protein